MAEAILITNSDVQTYRKIDTKFDSDKFDAFAMEVQRKNLKNLLGEALYYAFMNDDRASGIYKELLDGKVYEYDSKNIKYYGLKPVLCYWWLAIAAREGNLFQTDYGAVEFVNNPQQHFETAKEKEKIALNYIETAQDYANAVIKFLNENSTSYPLWNRNDEKSNSNFLTFKV